MIKTGHFKPHFKPPPLRNEHCARGDRGSPRRHALPRAVADHQHLGDGLRQPGEGQPRGGAGDGPAAGGADGEAGVHHRVPDVAQQKQHLNLELPLSPLLLPQILLQLVPGQLLCSKQPADLLHNRLACFSALLRPTVT